MNTRKCKLHYAELGKENEDVKEIVFSSSRKRFSFIADKIINRNLEKKIVFLIAIEKDYLEPPHKDPSGDSIYVFTLYRDIDFLKTHENGQWKDIFLFEYNSYEKAYKAALDMREPNPLCYSAK
jgi:hypothetical protein